MQTEVGGTRDPYDRTGGVDQKRGPIRTRVSVHEYVRDHRESFYWWNVNKHTNRSRKQTNHSDIVL